MKINSPQVPPAHRLLALAAATLLAASPATRADTLVEYTFATGVAPTTAEDGVEAREYAVPGTIEAGRIEFTPARNVFYERDGDPPVTCPDDAVANDWFSSFTVTAAPGFVLNLDQLAFDYGGTTVGNTFTANFFVRSSVDNFETDLASFALSLPKFTTEPLYEPGEVDLTGKAFQGLGSVTFRIYSYGTSDTKPDPGSRARIGRVTLTGTTSQVPAGGKKSPVGGGNPAAPSGAPGR